jgi:hypothetical protein
MAWNDNLAGPALRVASVRASPLRVRAGPGTGKTFALMQRLARLLEEGAVPEQVLLSTFTRTAATDLKAAVAALDAPGAHSVRATTTHRCLPRRPGSFVHLGSSLGALIEIKSPALSMWFSTNFSQV